MSNDMTTTRQRYAVLPSIVLAGLVVAFLLVSGARAEDPPIVAAGPVTVGGNTASGNAGSNGKTSACVNDQSSTADPSQSDTDSIANVNEGNCQASSGSGAGSGASGSGSGAGTASNAPASKKGTSPSARSRTASNASVAGSNANGLRIAGVRPMTKGVGRTKSFRVLVTLKDLQGRLVRDAIVSIAKAPGARNTVHGVCSAFTNRLGQANVLVHVDKQSLGKRLFMKVSGRTPKARAITLRSVRLPARG